MAVSSNVSANRIAARLRLEGAWLLVVCLLAGVLGGMHRLGPLQASIERFDLVFYDGLQWAHRASAPNDLVIVTIDEPSIEALGPWPWPRSRYAELIEHANSLGAKIIALDLLLVDPSLSDQVLVDAMQQAARAGEPIRLAVGVRDDGRQDLAPHPLFAAHASMGHAQFPVDADGNVRRFSPYQRLWPAFGLLLEPTNPSALAGLADRELWLPQLQSPPTTINARDLLAMPSGSATLVDKVVLIGAAAAGLGDRYPSRLLPGGQRLSPGVELHAVVHAAQAQAKFVRTLPNPIQAALSAAWIALSLIWLMKASPWAGLAGCAVAIVSACTVSALLLVWGYWWPVSAAILTLVLAIPLWNWRRMAAVVRQLRLESQSLHEATRATATELVLPSPADSIVRTVSQSASTSVSRREPVDAALENLRVAASQAVALQRFLRDCLDHLPHPALLARRQGPLLLVNEPWRRAFGDVPGDLRQLQPASLVNLIRQPEASMEYVDHQQRNWWLTTLTHQAEPLDLVVVQWVDVSLIRKSQRDREEVMRFLSHDMRSPLISMLAQIEDERRTALVASGQTLSAGRLDQLEAQARQSLELADQFTHLTRAESLPLQDEPVNLSFVIQQTVDACWQKARQKELRLHVDDRIEAGLGEAWVNGEAQLLRRALTNLIDNAIRFSPPGQSIDLGLNQHGDQFELTVRDYGPGIPPEHMGHLFDPFWRAPGQPDYGGVGLGLAFVHRVMQRHGGTVLAQSGEPGVRFVLRIPGLDAVKS